MRTIIIKNNFFGFHQYKEAPEEVKFLREFHSHNFFIESEIEVIDGTRELEFFIVKHKIDNFLNNFRDNPFEFSCEMLAQFIGEYLISIYGKNRYYKIKVFEDNIDAGTWSNG